ncbi:MAG TPA: GDP-mannose 4,6-dehydratase [Flavitalea sp.]|nr:GDP-mannose 4,6-dehydratase [Flavitalea sp.]
MKAIIFGANGQDGYYLSEVLSANNIDVIPVSRNGDVIRADVADFTSVHTLIRDHKPAFIFHLAASSTTRHEALFANHATISTGALNIFESVKILSLDSKIFISGSGLQFRNDGNPIHESDPFQARDAYSISRIQSVYAARYFRSIGLKIYVGYLFNHESPRRTEQHISRMIADRVKAISREVDITLTVGDLSVVKEWGYAGDIVKAIWTLVNQDEINESVLGTGKGYSIQEYIEKCFSFIGKDWRPYVKEKQGFRSEYRSLISQPSTIMTLGWKPETDLSQLVEKMLTE